MMTGSTLKAKMKPRPWEASLRPPKTKWIPTSP